METPVILVADADPKNLQILRDSLESSDFTVITASDGLDALELSRSELPDLILSEVNLPKFDGFQLLEKLKETPNTSSIPVMFLTNRRELQDRVRSLRGGVKDYLIKPVHVKEVIARIRMILRRMERTKDEEKDADKKLVGRLEEYSVVDLIENFGVERKTGVLNLFNEHNRNGEIFFRNGAVIHALYGTLKAEKAVYQMLPWRQGHFIMTFKEIDVEETISVSNLGLLLHGFKRIEQREKLFKQLPSPETTFVLTDSFRRIIARQELSREAAKFITLINGRRDIMQIIDESVYDDLKSLERLAKLHQQGFIKPGKSSEHRPPEIKIAGEVEPKPRAETTGETAAQHRAPREPEPEIATETSAAHEEEPPELIEEVHSEGDDVFDVPPPPPPSTEPAEDEPPRARMMQQESEEDDLYDDEEWLSGETTEELQPPDLPATQDRAKRLEPDEEPAEAEAFEESSTPEPPHELDGDEFDFDDEPEPAQAPDPLPILAPSFNLLNGGTEHQEKERSTIPAPMPLEDEELRPSRELVEALIEIEAQHDEDALEDAAEAGDHAQVPALTAPSRADDDDDDFDSFAGDDEPKAEKSGRPPFSFPRRSYGKPRPQKAANLVDTRTRAERPAEQRPVEAEKPVARPEREQRQPTPAPAPEATQPEKKAPDRDWDRIFGDDDDSQEDEFIDLQHLTPRRPASPAAPARPTTPPAHPASPSREPAPSAGHVRPAPASSGPLDAHFRRLSEEMGEPVVHVALIGASFAHLQQFAGVLLHGGELRRSQSKFFNHLSAGERRLSESSKLALIGVSMERQFTQLLERVRYSLAGYILIIDSPTKDQLGYLNYLHTALKDKFPVPFGIAVLNDAANGRGFAIDTIRDLIGAAKTELIEKVDLSQEDSIVDFLRRALQQELA